MNQQGRSMVEMLGVLTIIGVLSVGAIAGYSKAITKYRLNKSIETLYYVLNLTWLYMYDIKPGYNTPVSSNSLIPYFVKMGLVSESITGVAEGRKCLFDALGNRIEIDTNPPHAETVFKVLATPESLTLNKEECIHIFSAAQIYYNAIIYMLMVLAGGETIEYKGGIRISGKGIDLKTINPIEECKNDSGRIVIFFKNVL